MSADYVTVCSKFFRWILRKKSDSMEPIGFKELSSEYTTNEVLKSHLLHSYLKIKHKMEKLEGFTVIQKIHILFLIDKSPCKPFLIQMREAGKYRLSKLKKIQWFCSKDGTFKLERVHSILNEGNLIEEFSLFENIHIFFQCSRPVSEVFEEKIKKAGKYTLDKNRRITHFSSNDGSFERKDKWRNTEQELQEEEDDRDEELEEEMPDDSEQSNIRKDLEHEELDPEPMEDMDLDFEPEHREPTIQFENRQEIGHGPLAPEPISNELLEPAQNEPDFIPTFQETKQEPEMSQGPAPKRNKTHNLKLEPESENQVLNPTTVAQEDGGSRTIGAVKILQNLKIFLSVLQLPSLDALNAKVLSELQNPARQATNILEKDFMEDAKSSLRIVYRGASSQFPESKPDLLIYSEILRSFLWFLLTMGIQEENETVVQLKSEIAKSSADKVPIEKVMSSLNTIFDAATPNN